MSSPPRQPSRPPSPPQIKAATPVPETPPPQAAPLPPKPAPKARRKSLLDIKADKKAVLAAATENLKNLNQRVDRDGERESEEFGDRDSIQSFSKPFANIPEAEEDGRDSPPAIEYSLPPRRASIRMTSAPPPLDSNRGAGRRQSLSQSTPLSAAELKRGARLSTIQPFADTATDEEHALYAEASARAAQETVDAMNSLYHDPTHDTGGDPNQDYPPPSGEGEGYPGEYQQQQDYGGVGGEYGAYGNEYDGSGYGQDYAQNYQGCVLPSLCLSLSVPTSFAHFLQRAIPLER